MSSGKPCIDPDTSTMKMYSRPGMSAGATRFGGCIMSRKKFSLFPSIQKEPGLDSVAVEPVAQDVIAVAAAGFLGIEGDHAIEWAAVKRYSPCGRGRKVPDRQPGAEMYTEISNVHKAGLPPGGDRGLRSSARMGSLVSACWLE